MKKTIDYSDFREEFRQYGRENNYTDKGLEALFNYLEELEQDTGEEYELDIIELCCEFTEYENIEEFWVSYDKEDYPTLEDISDNTMLIMIDESSFIIQDF